MAEELPKLPFDQQGSQIQAPSFLDKIKIHRFLPAGRQGKILVGILGIFVLVGLKEVVIKPSVTPSPSVISSGLCQRDNDCTLAIRLDQCCSCPEPISLKVLEQDNNLVKYEEGKNYSREIRANCKNTVCDSCPPIEKPICQSGVCKSSFLDQEGGGEKVFCKDPRPEVCTMECIAQPPYICGSNGKSYCNKCQACANRGVDWYIIQNAPCGR